MAIANHLFLDKKLDKSKHIIATFYIESKLPLDQAANIVAGESSVGTWTEIKTLRPETFNRLSAKVIKLNKKNKIAEIAYPLILFEPGNIAQLLSCVAGNIFSLKIIKNIRLLDLDFSERYLDTFKGPAFGLTGVRKLFKATERPLIGCIMKPKIGLSWKEHARLAYEVFKNGVDLVKDDENLTDLSFNNFKKRVSETIKLARRAEKETGRKKLCAFNVSAPADKMMARAQYIKSAGGHCAMVDIITVGFSGLQALRNRNFGLILHGHRAMHSALTRYSRHGISIIVITKLARLSGIDQLHTGTVVGKMEGDRNDVVKLNNFLKKKWGKIKTVMPIASGGLYPGLIPSLYRIIGHDMIMNFGGGIHGHPQGSGAGAQAVKQALEATIKNVSLVKYGHNHLPLAQAIKKWGIL